MTPTYTLALTCWILYFASLSAHNILPLATFAPPISSVRETLPTAHQISFASGLPSLQASSFTSARSTKTLRPPLKTSISVVIGVKGGTVSLNNAAFIIVPAGAVQSDTRFTITRPTNFPKPSAEDDFSSYKIPSSEIVSIYQFSANKPKFQKTVQVIFPIDKPYPSKEEYNTDLYFYTGTEYNRIRIGQRTENFLYEPIGFLPKGSLLIAVRTKLSAVKKACTEKGGTFNGAYCELPFPK
jgi:RNA recognition motif-containing protein